MTTISYPIKRWGGSLTNNNINPHPVVYIKPDEELVKFAVMNDNKLLVSISDTNLPYENKQIVGIFKVDSNRPNYFNKTGYYMIELLSDWYGEPEDLNKLGNINIHGYKQAELLVPNSTNRLNYINGFSSDNTNSNTTSTFVGIFIFILVAVLIFYYMRTFRTETTPIENNNAYMNIKPNYAKRY